MEPEYDQKFEEMKHYIPFLESMIKRLEATGQGSSNPRQAQLDKIRSLRDLLLNKKKRMKMENLIKCEQVLVNLYAKVEQRETLSVVKKAPDPGFSIDPPTPQEKSDLEAVRNKLKNVAKRQEDVQETLPEILRVDELEEVHTAGSKEPALFQRRPNKSSVSPHSPTRKKEENPSPQSSASKRNYTRVLVSPDTSTRRWSAPESVEEKPLFSRRSPRRSPRRHSPSYHKKERKKSSKESTARNSKDLNITLNVPEDSLSTLNTKDIFNRIMNCKDGDVDIDTLRELRKQILTELKKTGARDDISDLILKSYNKKKGKRSKKDEVEEGELSDSESEVIENVYGSLSGNLVLTDQSEANTSTDKDNARKIKICLVINSDKNTPDSMTKTSAESINNTNVSELEMYDKNKDKDVINIDDDDDDSLTIVTNIQDETKEHNDKKTGKDYVIDEKLQQPPEKGNKVNTPEETVKYTANFYKPLTDSSETEEANKNKEVKHAKVETQKETDVKSSDHKTVSTVSKVTKTGKDVCPIEAELEQMQNTVEIPLLNEPTIPKVPTNSSTLSEIDILQALKNEILSESITISGSEAGTPLLHQPKINKVASAKEILPKKRISIENYKQKIESSIKFYFDENDSKDDIIKKPSLKLTEKEYERFKIQKKISFDDDSSDGDNGSEIQTSDIYSDLAPKSPDHDESSNMASIPPVIIPADPVKTLPVNRNADVDMRTLPILSPNQNKASTFFSNIAGISSDDTKSATKTASKSEEVKSQSRPVLFDPRVKRDTNSSHSPSPHTDSHDRTQRPAFSNIIKSPAMNAALTPVTLTPSAKLTPNARSYEMTPNHQSFEIDQSNKKHVYVPSFTNNDSRERENSVAKDSKIEPSSERKSRFDDIGDTSSWSSSDVSINTRYTDSFTGDKHSKGNDRYSLESRDSFSYKRSECPKTPLPSFGRSDVPVTTTQTFTRLDKTKNTLHSFGRSEFPTTPSHYFGKLACPPTPGNAFVRSECPPTPSHHFIRSECPPTPSHPFGRSECPPTPSHPFGRSECPPTPSHPFGRSECPPTPSHPFGRSECPPTPSHPFGRSECPPTPSHPFGRSECPPTPSHPFGRSECPPTPSHPFGRSDGPATPSHPFGSHSFNSSLTPSLQFGATECLPTPFYGRNECPPTTNHGFGRSDSPSTPNHPFGRSDFNAQKYNKDPRLNRKSEHESNSQLNERDRGYYKDRGYYHGSSYKSQKSFSGSDTYKNQDRERGQYGGVSSGYEDVALSRGRQRERSVGRSGHPDDKRERSIGRQVRAEDTFTRSSSRGPSIRRRNSSIEPDNKSLSVKSHVGRSFTIDTSVNATFQKFLETGKGIQLFEYNFDTKRQRAASVGRSLIPISSCEKVSKRNTETLNKKDVFRRASSMGRDLANSAVDKRSFQEVKADFKTYRNTDQESSKFDTGKRRNIDTKSRSLSESIGRSRKDKEFYEKYKEEKRVQSPLRLSYSPRKNNRDPRIHKVYTNKNKSEDSRTRKSGIVYSNDNIVKGAILSSGYGVKNYKIPKIKRVVEESQPIKGEPVMKKDAKEKDKRKNVDKRKDEEETGKEKAKERSKDKNIEIPKSYNKDRQKEKVNYSPKHKKKETPVGKIKEIIKETDTQSDSETEKLQIQIDEPDEQIGRRSTRLSRRLAGKGAAGKAKKSKKSIISDSDSETDSSVTEKLPKVNETNVSITDAAPSPKQFNSPVKENILSKQPNAVDIQTSFGLELEMFSDNVVSDPVLDNINALIADLDNDLDGSKNETSNKFTNEITLENMMENITSPQDNSSESRDEFTKVLDDVDELSKPTDNTEHVDSILGLNKGNEVNKSIALVSQEANNTENSTSKKSTTQNFDKLQAPVKSLEDFVSVQNNEEKDKKDESLNSSSLPVNKPTNEDIVSTTEIEKGSIPVEDKSNIDEHSMDGCSTPDSTNNTDVLDNNKTDNCVADSTNEEIQSEMNVTSTDSAEPKSNSSNTETASDLELGSLLTMLQDKSKIKKLLSMLGDQSGDNDRIKKKLEKLSEIVSDDEMEEKAAQPKENKVEVSVFTDQKNKIEDSVFADEKDKTQISVLADEKNKTQISVLADEKDKTQDSVLADEKDKAEVSVLAEEKNKTEVSVLADEKNETEVSVLTDEKNDKKSDANQTVDEKATKETESQSTDVDKQTDLNKEDQKNVDDQDKAESVEDFAGDDNYEPEQATKTKNKKKMPAKKWKSRKGKGRYAKKVTSTATGEKRVTRAATAVVSPTKPKKPPRELQKLHEDIKEMFLSEDILGSTGIRMCRLAKMVDEKSVPKDEVLPEPEPVVVLEKFKNTADKSRDNPIPEKVRKKPGPKPKPKINTESLPEVEKPKYKPGPKSKTKCSKELDIFEFGKESVTHTTTVKTNKDDSTDCSDSEDLPLASSKRFGSNEVLSEIKKKFKRKRGRGWQDGVLKAKHKKRKVEANMDSTREPSPDNSPTQELVAFPDQHCFIDKTYCFRKHETFYACRICRYAGKHIVRHYLNDHPHIEIPLSRMSPALAKEAIEQCKELNFNAVTKICSEKYVCIFCFKEFPYSYSVLETFFWHIVSMHTGEYKHTCNRCPNETQCPFRLDIPPPPKESKGQLVGFICKKCNFTQLSLENLKNHVINRHNDEQTAVYTINLSAMSKKALKEFLRRVFPPPPDPLPIQASSSQLEIKTSPSEQSSDVAECSSDYDCESEEAKHKLAIKMDQFASASIKSKITFEADDNVNELPDLAKEDNKDTKIKVEVVEYENAEGILLEHLEAINTRAIGLPAKPAYQPFKPTHQEVRQSIPTSTLENLAIQPSNDIVDYPHFKINITESGVKEYICCINGKDNHFKTALLISMKKHVELKHSENWDGYCYICKVIVTPQGAHKYKECFQHFLDLHMDNFPIYQKEALPESSENPAASKSYINVRPIRDLIPAAANESPKESSFPIIQSIASFGSESNPTYPPVRPAMPAVVSFKYEEFQAKVMLNKHRVVLETMMAEDKLVKVYKCAGRFCSFTSDSAEDALLHASTHQRIGGVDALNCSYCDFDAMGNAIDLVMHVFKAHGNCQYSCGQCFYRAAASELVGSHATRVHGVAECEAIVLRTTVAANNASDNTAPMLTRDQAAPSYICNHDDDGTVCMVRFYTSDLYLKHVKQQHETATSHPCYLCPIETPSATELIDHMRSHGLRLYQCNWCFLGADSEPELLDHVSAAHPTKVPQAYLRITACKNGADAMRVLPLVFLNKLQIPSKDVTPSATTENPVREAERSIDLEKLIGLTMMIDSQAELEPAPEHTEHPQDIIPEDTKTVEPSVASTTTVVLDDPVLDLQAEALSPVSNKVARSAGPNIIDFSHEEPLVQSLAADPSLTITKVPIKAEVAETFIYPPGEVVVLDSDDEDVRQPVIDLSDEDTTPTPTKSPTKSPTNNTNSTNQTVPMDILSTCPKCQQICKSINGLKKHFYYCYPNKNEGCKCAHCPYMASSRDNIMHHYMHDHCDRNVYQCGVCRVNLVTLAVVKRHLRFVHKEKDFVVTSTTESGITYYVVNIAKREKKEMPKRKLTAPTPATETLTKRRFWPQEINQLPINPILDQLVYCEMCEFSTKVRLNMVRHLQLHAEQQPVAQTAPVNPVPHLETNEKHFDRMVNLASSSLVSRTSERPAERVVTAVHVTSDVAAKYPRQISARQRNTCGAVGCTYTSVDESMLKRHWEALHAGSTNYNFRCVHCPLNQVTDTTKPITATRVVQHLKMHDDTLYACSNCHVFHYKRDFMEKHILDHHSDGVLYIVRESAAAAAASASATSAVTPSNVASPSAAPTMDLKPWQCGFCKFKSMLRPEVAEHCFKLHQSKMQFRCGYCPYRASVLENVNNHLLHSHADEPQDVIYYYYREGSLPDAEDGTPRWMTQRQKMGTNLPEVKTEEQEVSDAPEATNQPPLLLDPPVKINLDLVKKEVDEAAVVPHSMESMEDLCQKFGQFCEPNGIMYKCPLCNIISEDTREAMQSHLYEELQYRKWGCGLCNYKAFHKAGLTDHMSIEHCRQYDHIELPIDTSKEKWVAGQLDYQAAIIDKHKANLAKQKITVERFNKPATVVTAPAPVDVVEKYSVSQLKEAFGEFGVPRHMMYCCPKCSSLYKDEAAMRDHLETELNKIRWGCTNCSDKYQTYHEARFHCKGHDGPSRPKEAIRDPSMRAAWVTNIIQAQKKLLQSNSDTATTSEPLTPEKNFTENDNNSLLVVRYEERVATPDQVSTSRKRSAPESDDERLVIDEVGHKKKTMRTCPHCTYVCKYYNSWKEHVLKHHNLKPYSCCYCDYSCSYRQGIIGHTEKHHPTRELLMKMTGIPPAQSYVLSPKKRMSAEEEPNIPKLICLFCERSIPEVDVDNHLHENIRPDFAKKGDVVVKCCICLVLRLDVKSLQDHHNLAHPHVPINYAWFKLHHDTRETHFCGYCDDLGFKFIRDLKSHQSAAHPTLPFKYTTLPYAAVDDYKDSKKKEESAPKKRCARKSTTKLPLGKTVAKKSTTKLPYSIPSIQDGYSYYKTKPEPLANYANVTTLMSFCNRMMPFTLKKLSEIINLEPKVIVNDIRAGNSSHTLK